jgi:hypothetical protein
MIIALLAEVKILFPEIENISLSNHTFNDNTDGTRTVPVLIYKTRGLDQPSEEKTGTVAETTFSQKTD